MFTAQQCAAIDEIITNYVYGKMDKRTGKRNNGANELEGEHMDMARFRYNDGIEALKNIKGATFPMSYTNAKGDEVEYDYTPFMQLQTAMVTYFLRDYVKMTVKRFLDMGLNFKQLEQVQAMASIEAKQSYMMASSNRGNIVAFDIDDIMDEFVFDSMRLTFSETMFDSADDAVKVCFMRLKNVMRVQLRKLRNQTLVVTEQQMYVQEEGVSRSTEEEALQMAKEMGIFSDAEMEIIRLRLEGFKKVEIDKQVGKRTDRDFKRIEKAYNAAV
ncbi:hypothetical protein PAV_141p01570 (plasmid) [Paenibacillus alvei DSM 29]|nr:hypothetical protein PAV_141p01570 [Paenibacillus alvei DSM 29]